MARIHRPKNRKKNPRAASWRSSSASSYSPRRIAAKIRTIPARITRFSNPIRNKNEADTIVPARPPNRCRPVPVPVTAGRTVFSATMMAAPIATTTVQWPREKKNPHPNGRGAPVPCRSPMILRVVLSIAEMWSASNACRRPRV